MTDFTDDTVHRYLEQNPGLRDSSALDPATHHHIELMSRTLDAADRAMAEEGVPDGIRRRVLNRVVWGDPEGKVDVYAKAVEQTFLAARACMPDMRHFAEPEA